MTEQTTVPLSEDTPASKRGGKVFISYAHAHSDACEEFALQLRSAGIDYFVDTEGLIPGHQWQVALTQAMTDCSVFVMLVGQAGMTAWMRKEFDFVWDLYTARQGTAEALTIIPVLLDNTSEDVLPIQLRDQIQASKRWTKRDDLPADLLTAIQSRSRPATHDVDDEPFVGLRSFAAGDEHRFHGRLMETVECMRYIHPHYEHRDSARLPGQATRLTRWLEIRGDSGSGKSSLLLAGVVPKIHRQNQRNAEGGKYHVIQPFTPGTNPLANLVHAMAPELGRYAAAAGISEHQCTKEFESDLRNPATPDALGDWLRRLASKYDGPLATFVLVIDQFEELYTAEQTSSQTSFDAQIAACLADQNAPLVLLAAIRLDHATKWPKGSALARIYNQPYRREYVLHGMGVQALVTSVNARILPAPGDRPDLRRRKEMIRQISRALAYQAQLDDGALALFEHALTTLWSEPSSIKAEKYFKILQDDGIAGLLGESADQVLEAIKATVSAKARDGALELLFRLTQVGDTVSHTRLRLPVSQAIRIAGRGGEALGRKIVDILSGVRPSHLPGSTAYQPLRLLIVDSGDESEPKLTLIHETLIRARPETLRQPPIPGQSGRTDEAAKATKGPWPSSREAGAVGIWPTLFDYIEANRKRAQLNKILIALVERWKGFGWPRRLVSLGSWSDFMKTCRFLPMAKGVEKQYLYLTLGKQSIFATAVIMVALYAAFLAMTLSAGLPYTYAKELPRWLMGTVPTSEMVRIEPGEFFLGCADVTDDTKDVCGDLLPAHPLRIDRPFLIGKHEVTYLQFDRYVWQARREGNIDIAYPDDPEKVRGDRPVANVSWRQAQAYVKWLSNTTGRMFALPSEAQWEFAARGGKASRQWWAISYPENEANCRKCATPKPTGSVRVGSFKPNAVGLHDMLGNVFEWVADQPPGQKTMGDDDSAEYIIRGGGWNHGKFMDRVMTNDGSLPYIGFRVVEMLPVP